MVTSSPFCRPLGLVAALVLISATASAEEIYIAGGGNNETLYRLDSAMPGVTTGTIPITGLLATDWLQDIDFRPATGELYAITVDNFVFPPLLRLYRVALPSGAATATGSAVPLPQSGNVQFFGYYSLELNPVTDEVQITGDFGDNFRLDPDTGAVVGIGAMNVSAQGGLYNTAFDRNDPTATATTLFALALSQIQPANLVRLGGVDGTPSPDSGTVTLVGPTGLASGSHESIGFDVSSTGTAFLTIEDVNDGRSLYSVDLVTGTATLIGAHDPTLFIQRGLAVAPAQGSVVAVPTLSESGFLLLAGALALAGAWWARRAA